MVGNAITSRIEGLSVISIQIRLAWSAVVFPSLVLNYAAVLINPYMRLS
jgi:hypothetical protein